jgi:predicted outer membrane repeat protein
VEVLEDRLTPATLTVNSTADTAHDSDPYLSLREAIALVNSPTLPSGLSRQILAQIDGDLHAGQADTIRFDPGQVAGPIILGGTQLELSLPGSTASITINGGAGVTVDGNDASRIFQVDSGVQVALDHLTLTNGHATGETAIGYGGGIFNLGRLTVSNSTLAGNSAAYSGGGIYSPGSVTVTNSTLTGNSAHVGGGIAGDAPVILVTNSNLTGNSCGNQGGAIYAYLGDVTVSNSTLAGNSASEEGGALYVTGSRLTVSNSALTGNSTYFVGGAISVNESTVSVSNSTLTDNSSVNAGGGIFADAGLLTVSNSTLTGNSASRLYGGGITEDFGHLTVTRSSLARNSAPQGGGLAVRFGTATVADSTLAANSANQGGGLFIQEISALSCLLRGTLVAGNRGSGLGTGPDITGPVDGLSSYNLVGLADDSLSGIHNGVSHNQIGTSASPLDPRLAPLGWYGGPTPTFALLPGGPARDAGDPAAAATTDQRGMLGVVAGQSDIGAFQTQADPFLVTTLQDPGRQPGLLSLREAVSLANVLPGDHTVSFDPGMDGGAVRLSAGQLELSGAGGVTTIDGAGRFTLDGDGATRLVQVDPGTTAVLRGLALVNGNAPLGAGVYNRGTLTVADCVLYGNTGYAGGAVLNQGDLTVYGSTLGFNVATLGAAIDNEGLLTAYNSTIGYNAALESGGAIRNDPTGTAVLTSLTVSRNSADEGGGLDVAGGLVVLRNCVVAGNYTADGSAASDIAGTVDRGSTYDLVGTGGSGGLLDGVGHNLVGVTDPGLTTPDFSGPQTPTFGLTDDSPAVGAGDPTLLDDPLLRLDQHGNGRTVVNIGAV